MKNMLALFLITLSLASCMKGESADIIIHNASIHTMDPNMSIHEAMAIKDGKILEIGPERQILNKYAADEEINAEGKDIYPGLTDAHTHVFSLMEQKLSAYLFGLKSWDAVLVTLEKFQEKSKHQTIVGRGWDEANWNATSLPNNETLNKLFPNQAVIIYRADGHTALVNDYLLKKMKINENTKIEGGEIQVVDGKCTGILIDNALEKAKPFLPKHTEKALKNVFFEIQNELLMYGITNIHEAGISFEQLQFLKKLNLKNELKINVYAMLYASEANISFARKYGHYKNKKLHIRSFKVLLDGALGSRGAWLKESYNDRHNHFGLRTLTDIELKRIALICEETNYQLNGHAIGDAANLCFINACADINQTNKDHRWRIEHAQVIDPNDFKLLENLGVYPSVQPTHAVSDQRWAEQRLGKNRMKGAYAYNSLLTHTGIIVLGTDFPVENMDPFATIFAATKRKNTNNEPLNGFYKNEALDLDNTLKAMTIWPAYASFSEIESGSLEKGKDATLVIFDKPIVMYDNYQSNFSFLTMVKGKKVYSID